MGLVTVERIISRIYCRESYNCSDIAELRNTSQFTILRMKNFVRLQHKQSRTFYRLLHNNISNNFYALESGMDLESACHGQKKDVTSNYNLVELTILN